MTDDFKNKLLKYLTGTLEIETGVNEPQFSGIVDATNNLETYLTANLGAGYVIKGVLQGKNASNDPVELSVMYGNYSSNTKGFMVILDQDFTPLQTLIEYVTGTDFSPFETLSVGEDSLLFGIDNNGGTKRFILLNNVVAKLPAVTEYTAILRQSYNLPSPSSTYTTYTKVLKASGRGKYLIVGSKTTGGDTNPVATELEIVVGSTNVWTDFTYGSAVTFTPLDAFASWDENGDITFKIGGIGTTITQYGYFEYSGTYASTSMTRDQIGADIVTPSEGFTPVHMGVKLLSLTIGYLAYGLIDTESLQEYLTDYIVDINYTNDSLDTIYNVTYHYDAANYTFMGVTLFNIDTEMFYFSSIVDVSDVAGTKIGKIIGTAYYETSIYSGDIWDTSGLQLLSVQKQFNLYNYYFQIGDVVSNSKQVYNVLNYNGLEYSAENTLIPNNVILYTPAMVDLATAIFARNLYNKTVNGATTTSTVEIPNNFLNGEYTVIGYKDLMSETNTQMVSDDTAMTKNIYENVLLNFINTIVIKNNNDPLNETLNNIGAIRLNSAINVDLSYDNAKALKIKRTFGGGATDTYDIPIAQISYVGNVATIDIYTYIPTGETLLKVEIMSYDLVTSYLEIDMSNYDSNKFYKITQEIEVI